MLEESKNVVIGTNVPFSRIRRITGYLVGDMDRWNDAKKAEESQRVKHFTKDDIDEGREDLVCQKIA